MPDGPLASHSSSSLVPSRTLSLCFVISIGSEMECKMTGHPHVINHLKGLHEGERAGFLL